ncbi:hypothetical protein EW145_g2266 [Phellinidium pouzarii]|uniref:DH domain-containing protein n=1 Tax=Phellinidium pouzarii TaxID=167371 RepID=A0A4S4LBQ8_9AGAM|nr:hypothetical protein EW145_g2266 [Phellinidium pouzarii]
MENVLFSPVTLAPTAAGGPRSRRMGGILQSPPFLQPRPMDSKPITPPISPKDESPPMLSPSKTSSFPPPPPPPRSPLRPSPRSITSFNTLVDLYTKRDTVVTIRTDEFGSVADRRKSMVLHSALFDQYSLNSPIMLPTPGTEFSMPDNFSLLDDKPLPVPPDDDDSPLSSPTATISLGADASETSTVSTLTATAHVTTKREHALKELLTSERAYASDLAFVRNVHIPMALGKSAPFQLPRPLTPPRSSGSSVRTVSTYSESSSNSSHPGSPMTKDDVRVIFGNIAELAVFSDTFSERLQDALGDVLEDGKGEDWVGALFLEIIPQLEPPYKTYITRHPSAIKHLSSLPQTPALATYLAQTQSLASSVTHAWDLPSLLIKPVQRLLKYSLLLATIIEQTPDGHGDKENLRKARDLMEDVARGVNEGRRRMEVVKEILTGKTDVGKPTTLQKKLSIGKSTQAGVGRMKSMNAGLRASRTEKENNEELAHVAEYEKQLRKCEAFVRDFAKDVVGWSHTVRASQTHLRAWTVNFGTTIGISDKQPSEAFNAFLDVMDIRLMPLCQELDNMVAKDLLPELASLLDTTKAPIRLLTAMHSLAPLHYALLDLNYSKHRPQTAMLEASQSYIALRGQLATDLPKYLKLFDRGIVKCIHHFAHQQTDFWSSVRDQWATLWDCLRMEGETNAGCEETLTLWWSRYSEVEEVISKLNILKRDKPSKQPRSWTESPSFSDALSTESPRSQTTPLPNSTSSALSGSTMRHRSFGSLDPSSLRNMHRSPSVESFPSLSQSQRIKSRPRTPESLGRSKGRLNTSPLPSSSSQRSLNMYVLSSSSTQTYLAQEYAESIDSRSDVHGRKSRSSSLSRKLSETLRTPLRRSPSQKSVASQRSDTFRTGNKQFPPLNLNCSATPPLPRHGDHIDLVPPPNSPSIYFVSAIHACSPPDGAVYLDLPFFELQVGDIFGVLSELGHPSNLEGLCLGVDEGQDDCLLVVKNEIGDFGLALSSFLLPIP